MDLYSENSNVTPVLNFDWFKLRPMVVGDVDAAVSALSQWDVTKWLTSVPWPFEAEHAEDFITNIAPRSNGPIWAIDQSGKMVGVVGADPNLGYWLHPEQHGQGLMTHAAGAVVDWVFEQDASELASGYLPDNAASRRVLSKLGFQASYIEEVEQVATGEMVLLQRVALSRSRWQTLRSQSQ